jgi:2-polyprenyl-3-methyl-5-hydroxy-6-metoxy-1,4-benzoquinol methylase
MSQYKDYGFFNEGATHVHQDMYAPLLKHLQDQKNYPILDLGCGNGSLVRFLLAQGFDAYGTDASPKGIEIALKAHPARFALQNLEEQNLPQAFDSIPFKCIISTEVIEHLYDPRTFIAFCKKALIKQGGGQLILTTPYHGYLKNLLIALNGSWDQHLNPLWDGGHIKMWSKKTLSALLEEYGFKITGFEGCGRIPYVWKSMMLIATI